MRKSKIFSTIGIGAVGIGTMSYLLLNKNDKHNNNPKNVTFKIAGVPEIDHEENAKMVSEGSQFGVNYYNQIANK